MSEGQGCRSKLTVTGGNKSSATAGMANHGWKRSSLKL